ncbi:MAG: TPM domain-containing protein [Dysgonamonadaceae bacterium]|jgi:uncharacterized protein|nr:TPM domain-containing protein [Dysgonamonadaceae bacterium]
MKRFLISLITIIGVTTANAGQYTVETVPNDHLKDARDYTTNPDGIISAQAEQEINGMLASVESYATAEVAVVLLESIGSDDIDDFATKLFKHWGLGKKEKNSGLLFLLVQDQRGMVFRSGSGIEGVFPDVILSRIIRNDISPKLKNGDFDGGMLAGISRISEIIKNPEVAQELIQKEKNEKAANSGKLIHAYLIIGTIIFLMFFASAVQNLKSKKTNHIKCLKMRKLKAVVIICSILFPVPVLLFLFFYFITISRLRNKPINCSNCGCKMHKLSEKEEDVYLTPAQQNEESVKSIDYDVWLCDNCKNKEILPYTKPSMYTTCPHCHAKTYHLSDDRVLQRATTFSRGQGQKTYFCKNCHSKDLVKYIIPMIIIASGGSGKGGSWGGGSGFGGGSWGGGGTGGGGARGGW